MKRVTISRSVELPDPRRLSRCRKAPEDGPKLLFFTGGTALREVSRQLIEYTHNSIHLVTPFDSGGSSAKLREAFGMLAVGDLRNRLMALADRSLQGNPEVFALFAYRFPRDEDDALLRDRLDRMVQGRDEMVAAVLEPMQALIRNHLRFFQERMPADFDLRGANVGNLIIAGGYLNQRRHIAPVLFLFSRLVEVRGVVRPISSENAHLAAELEDGTLIQGQHRMTGKETAPLHSPIRRLFLIGELEDGEPAEWEVDESIAGLVAESDLICYPMGSYYTSLIANLLPRGVADAVAATNVPKVFIPNCGHDPEQLGMSLADSVETLLAYLFSGCREPVSTSRLLNFVMVDSQSGGYAPRDLAAVQQLGVEVIELPLITEESAPLLDAERLVQALVSMG